MHTVPGPASARLPAARGLVVPCGAIHCLLPQFTGECRQEESGACVRPAAAEDQDCLAQCGDDRDGASVTRGALLWQKSREAGAAARVSVHPQAGRSIPTAICDDKDAFFDAPDTCQSRRRGAGGKVSDSGPQEVSKRKKTGAPKRTSRSPAKNAVGKPPVLLGPRLRPPLRTRTPVASTWSLPALC